VCLREGIRWGPFQVVGFDGRVEVECMEVLERDRFLDVMFDDFVVAREGLEADPRGGLVDVSLRRGVLDVSIVVLVGVEV